MKKIQMTAMRHRNFANRHHANPFGTCAVLKEKVPFAKVFEVKSGGRRSHFVGEQTRELNPMILDFLLSCVPVIEGFILAGGNIVKMNKCVKDSFVVIGKEGSTLDGENFIQKLWEDANSHFAEVQHLAKKDEDGNICGIWGAMSDFFRSFNPWEDFSKGLYLAGVECNDNAEAPDGWTRWRIPGYEYIYVECDSGDVFSKVMEYMKDNGISLVGAVHDFICPRTGKNYLYFPIRKL